MWKSRSTNLNNPRRAEETAQMTQQPNGQPNVLPLPWVTAHPHTPQMTPMVTAQPAMVTQLNHTPQMTASTTHHRCLPWSHSSTTHTTDDCHGHSSTTHTTDDCHGHSSQLNPTPQMTAMVTAHSSTPHHRWLWMSPAWLPRRVRRSKETLDWGWSHTKMTMVQWAEWLYLLVQEKRGWLYHGREDRTYSDESQWDRVVVARGDSLRPKQPWHVRTYRRPRLTGAEWGIWFMTSEVTTISRKSYVREEKCNFAAT